MTRRIFTLIAAYPVDVQEHELPRVRVDSYVVEGATVRDAYDRIKNWDGVSEATEVMGSEVTDLCICPTNTHRREESLQQWEHWSRMVDARALTGWSRLARGPESFRDRIARLFVERHPEFS